MEQNIDTVLTKHIDNTFKTIKQISVRVRYNGDAKPTVKLIVKGINILGRDAAELPITDVFTDEVDLADTLPDNYCWYERDNPYSLATGSYTSWPDFIKGQNGLMMRVNNFARCANLKAELIEEG